MKKLFTLSLFTSLLFFTLSFQETTEAQVYNPLPTSLPNGTLVLGNKHSLLGNHLKTKMRYSHVGIVYNGMVCESDFPRSTCTPIASWQKPRTTYDWYIPVPSSNHDRLGTFIQNNLNQPYQVRNYLFPRSRRTQHGWCSTWVGEYFSLSREQSWNPEILFDNVKHNYTHSHTTHSKQVVK